MFNQYVGCGNLNTNFKFNRVRLEISYLLLSNLSIIKLLALIIPKDFSQVFSIIRILLC